MVSGHALIVALVGMWLLRAPAFADAASHCVESVYAQDAAAKRDWSRSVRDLNVKARPDLTTLATLDMQHQLALVDRRQAQFSYLIRTEARRIRTRQGLVTFRNFDWTDTDAIVLRQQSPSYATLERKVVDLERQTKGHSDWPTLQDVSRTVLAVTPQFQGLLKRLQASEAAVERLLDGCQPSR